MPNPSGGAPSFLRDFIERVPLYTPRRFRTILLSDFPAVITQVCGACGGERPYRRRGPQDPGVLRSSLFSLDDDDPDSLAERMSAQWIGDGRVVDLDYRCSECGGSALFWCHILPGVEKTIRKVGQWPPIETAVQAEVGSAFGGSADLLRRAKTCIAHGFGIGACAYLRRLLEESVDGLLKLLREIMRHEGDGSQGLAELSATIEHGSFEDKSVICGKHLPRPLRTASDNPLKVCFGRCNDGIHNQDDHEATSTAQEVAEIVERLALALKHQAEDAIGLAETVRKQRAALEAKVTK